MPLRNEVPSLKLLALRKVVEPNSLLMTSQNITVLEEQRRNYELHTSQSMRTSLTKSLLSSNEQVMNALIRMNHYCGTGLSLTDMKFLTVYLHPKSITTLDFLHIGFRLHDDTSIESFAGSLPYTVAPMPLSLLTWLDLTKLLTKTGNDGINNLYVLLNIDQSVSVAFRDQIFKSFMGFTKLVRLVLHGNIGDTILAAIGFACKNLRMLDLRGSNVTDKGILQLLVKNSREALKQAITYKTLDMKNIILYPVANTLKYLDISTVPSSGFLMDDDLFILNSCANLCGTPNRLFFDPGGISKVYCVLEKDIEKYPSNLRARLSSKSRYGVPSPKGIVDLWLRLRPHFTFSEIFTGLEVRVNINGEESSFLFYHRSLVTLECQLENLTIIQIHSYAKSRAIFIPIDVIAEFASNIQIIKASLEGTVTENTLVKLEKVTMPMCHHTDTLVSLVKFSPALIYLEVGEILLSKADLNDSDIVKMITSTSGKNLEVIRFMFYNVISLVNGLRIISLNCPKIKLIGDLKYWNIAIPSLSKFMLTMSSHNFNLMIEYDGLLYHTNTPCNEFFE